MKTRDFILLFDSESTDSGHSSDAARQPAATPPIVSSVSTWVFTDHS